MPLPVNGRYREKQTLSVVEIYDASGLSPAGAGSYRWGATHGGISPAGAGSYTVRIVPADSILMFFAGAALMTCSRIRSSSPGFIPVNQISGVC